ncbi:MAG TPA: hypothetical protein VNI57_02125 [Candidatus Saccharimonadales bacterium]|nr:hypothetical protein [Candidatus Saccharimonadales bacterium]
MGNTTIGTGASKLRAQAGGAGVKFIISVAILALVAHVAYIAIPVYVAVYDFESQLDKEAQFGSQKTNAQILDGLVKYAADRHLPVAQENIQIIRSHTAMQITCDFVVPVETLVYTYQWRVQEDKKYPLF